MLYVLVLGLVPALIVALVRLPDLSFRSQTIQRLRFFGVGLLAVLLFVVPTIPHFASFLREHKNVRNLLNPAQPIYATLDYWLSTDFVDAGWWRIRRSGPPDRVPGQKPLLLFVVNGETVRAQNFQLGGCARPPRRNFRSSRACSISTTCAPAEHQPPFRCPAWSRISAMIVSTFARRRDKPTSSMC